MRPRPFFRSSALALAFFVLVAAVLVIVAQQLRSDPPAKDSTDDNAVQLVDQGRRIFRFDTFGDEAFWGDTLRLHQAIEGAGLGGVGGGLSPQAALAAGLKVDVDALPQDLLQRILHGSVDLTSPATTVALLKLNAVVGVTGFLDSNGALKSVGIQCSLCHSTVDNSQQALCPSSVHPNAGTGCVGHRLDGWPNRDLNVGAIIALAPNLSPLVTFLSVTEPGITPANVQAVLNSWGPGKFDAELVLDGKASNRLRKKAVRL